MPRSAWIVIGPLLICVLYRVFKPLLVRARCAGRCASAWIAMIEPLAAAAPRHAARRRRHVRAVVLGVRNHNFSYVDIGWSVNFAVLGVLYATLAPGYLPRRVLIAAMFAAHGLRLGWHLAKRIIGEPEEGRYVQLRKDWGGSGNLEPEVPRASSSSRRCSTRSSRCRC